jgi:DNA-binding beta-propeller fold protein YncE
MNASARRMVAPYSNSGATSPKEAKVAIVPAFPPQKVIIESGFDYLGADVDRRRIYAAHSGSGALTVVNADTGAVLGQVDVGLLHGVAVNPDNGHVYTGDSEKRMVVDVDPSGMSVGPSVAVTGLLDAVVYDAKYHHIYADEDDGTRIFVVDSRTMKLVGTVALPGHKPEYMAIDPRTHNLYQNIANISEFVVVNPDTLRVVQTVKTPEIVSNHGLALDGERGHVYIAGRNGVLSVYDLNGTHVSSVKFGRRSDQCMDDPVRHNVACAGDSYITVFHDGGAAGVSLIGERKIDPDVHTLTFDTKTGCIWTAWAAKDGDYVQGFQITP